VGASVVDSQKPLVENEPVLSRWSRLKRGQKDKKDSISKSNENALSHRDDWAIDDGAESDVSAPSNASPEARATAVDSNEETLPSLADIALDKDFTPFMRAKVPEALKRQALKALFKDTHFNTMDGLDTYIDDYTKFEPITAEEMAGLSSWKSIMKPLEQVVTPGGYAVDVESEEGKAVLAARDALMAQAEASESEPNVAGAGEPEAIVHAPQHERHGKRVGDFAATDTSPAESGQREALSEGNNATTTAYLTENVSLTRPSGRPLPTGEVVPNDDPR
jgi:hypothetical protein